MSETESIRTLLMKHKPHRVRAYDGDDLTREVPVPAGRKRWAAVIEVVERLDWSRLELVDRSGGVLAVYEPEPEPEVGVAPEATEPAEMSALTSREISLVDLVLRAQQMALANRERETALAMNACSQAVKMMTDAVGSLAQIQKASLDAQRELAADRAERADEPAEGLVSEKVLAQMLPMILARLGPSLLAPPAVAPAGGSKNGAPK